MHFYDRIINFLGIPNEQGHSLDKKWDEKNKKSANFYNTVKQIHPLYRWNTIVVSKTDFEEYLKETDRAIKRLCGIFQWELASLNSFQRSRTRREGESFGSVKEEDENYIMEYTSILVLKRKMDKEEFYNYIKNASDSLMSLSDEMDIDWDSNLDSQEL